MEPLLVIKEFIPRETLTKFRFYLVIVWIAIGTLLFTKFSGIEIKESSFQCDVTGDNDKDFIRDECYHQYVQNYNLGIPPDFFILINVALIPIVTMLYSCYVKSTVNRLKRSHQDAEPRNRRGSRRLCIAYLFQLVFIIALGITFIVLLETYLHYPRNFSCSRNKIFPVKFLLNRTQSTYLFTCHYDQIEAGYPNFWTKTATAANAIYGTSALLEILWILYRARNGETFMYNQQFYADHLKRNSDDQRQAKPGAMLSGEPQHPQLSLPLTTDSSEEPENSEPAMTFGLREHAQSKKDFQSAIQKLKEDCLRGTEQLSDLIQPFRRPNPYSIES